MSEAGLLMRRVLRGLCLRGGCYGLGDLCNRESVTHANVCIQERGVSIKNRTRSSSSVDLIVRKYKVRLSLECVLHIGRVVSGRGAGGAGGAGNRWLERGGIHGRRPGKVSSWCARNALLA